jgi:hypothetical protein
MILLHIKNIPIHIFPFHFYHIKARATHGDNNRLRQLLLYLGKANLPITSVLWEIKTIKSLKTVKINRKNRKVILLLKN